MKKIAIVTKKMVIGGTEKALLSMLKQFSPDEYSIDLYLQEMGGELLSELPKWINVFSLPAYHTLSMKQTLRHPLRFLDAIINRLNMNEEEEYYRQCERACHCMPLVEKTYDVAIAYHAPDAVPFYYVIHNLQADKKIMWLHFDIEKTNAVNPLASKYFHKYNQLFSVSRQVKDIFDRNYPELIDKSEVFYNMVDVDDMIKKAKIGPSYTDGNDAVRLLSIGRLTYQKGYDRLLPVIKDLAIRGYHVKLYICGEGEQRGELESIIHDLNLESSVTLLGMQSNPYGYLNDCDIYVQPSRFEGYCTTTNEARVFAKPILVTDVCGMREQLEDHVTGSIVMENENAILDGLIELLESKELRERYRNNLKRQNFDALIDINRI